MPEKPAGRVQCTAALKRCVSHTLLFAASLLVGCGRSAPGPSDTASAPPKTSEAVHPSLPVSDVPADAQWDVFYMSGAKAGYGWTAATTVIRDGQELRELTTAQHLQVSRGGEQAILKARFTTLELPNGELLEFATSMDMGESPTAVTGKVAGGKLHLVTTSAGRKENSSIDCPNGTQGFLAVEQSFSRQPMEAGERRVVTSVAPIFNQVAQTELVAGKIEPVELLGRTKSLLRIDGTTVISGTPMATVYWTDATGQVLKSFMPAMGFETYRTSREAALSTSDAPDYDVLTSTIVKLDQPLPNALGMQAARYRILLDGQSAEKIFKASPSQTIRPIDEHTIELAVRVIRPDEPPQIEEGAEQPPTDEDRLPNNLVQSEDLRISQMADRAAGRAADPWQAALALERFVHDEITQKNFSQTFASAAEVAASREGDCTEHAVLLAALARARKIPARVATGLVYVPSQAGFGYHMWTEVWIDDRWIGLDGTLGGGGVSAAHLKLSHSSLKAGSAYESFLPVAQVMGRLEIEVLE